MKTAILGGTFNPVHIGHLFLADEIIQSTEYKQVIFVPTFSPAHKTIEDRIEPRHRLAMLDIACKPYPCFGVDDCEIKRGGTSYMIDTLQEIHRTHTFPEKPGLIIGDDLAQHFQTWKNPEQILALAELLVVRRIQAQNSMYNYPCRQIENKIIPVSSTEIRERIKTGKPVRFLLPEGVFSYIFEYELYR